MGSRVNEVGNTVPIEAGDPASSLRAVTPHASNELPNGRCRALWIGGAGNISVVAENDQDPVTINAVASGTLLPIRAKAVRVSGTTATGIIAFY
jgi:hypothetical protein